MGLGVIRAFANKPVDIIALSYEDSDFAHRSKYVKEWFKVPHPVIEEQKFIEFLIKNSIIWKGAILFDTDDNIAVTLSKNKKFLSEYYKVISADWNLMKMFIEKKHAWQLALESGVAHPLSYSPSNLYEFSQIRTKINFPCILKPVKSHEFVAKFNIKNFEVHNLDQYDKYVNICLDENQEVMVQEIIPGPVTNLYKCMTYINSKNEMAGMFFYNKIRQNPPQYGVVRVCVSTGRNDEVEELFRKLLENSCYRGFCTVEFKKDPRDGLLKFIEINVRMPRMISIATACGVNIPWIIYKDLVQNVQLKFNNYKKNLYWIEINSDIFNSVFRHSKENFSFREYLKPYFSKNKTFAIYDRKDMFPYLLQTIILPKKLFK